MSVNPSATDCASGALPSWASTGKADLLRSEGLKGLSVLRRRRCRRADQLQEQPQGEQDQFRAEQDNGRCRRAERLAGVDGGCREPSECGPADETSDMRRVADIGDGESEVEVQGGQDQELADQGILPGEGAAAHRVTEYASQQTEDRAGSTYGRRVKGAEVEVGDAPGEPARQVEREKTVPSERLLHERAEEVKGEHVQG